MLLQPGNIPMSFRLQFSRSRFTPSSCPFPIGMTHLNQDQHVQACKRGWSGNEQLRLCSSHHARKMREKDVRMFLQRKSLPKEFQDARRNGHLLAASTAVLLLIIASMMLTIGSPVAFYACGIGLLLILLAL